MKKNVYQLICVILCLTMITACILTGCKTKEDSSSGQTTQDEKSSEEVSEQEEEVPVVQGLEYERTMELDYAESFDVYYYREGYKLIDVHNDRRYLIVPEESDVPKELDSDIIVLEQPLDCIYLAATSAMALFDAIDSIGAIRMSGTQASGWYIEHAVEAMEAGDIIYAGKYSEPDYEMLIDEGCDLAIESTMILHTPKVQEMIEDLDIPVFIDRSSYESHPLGRTEWVKLYAAMMNQETVAEEFFAEQTEIIEQLKDFKNTEKTVAFFYVSTNGTVVVRKSEDYIPKMIEIAGGRYVFEDLENKESDSAAVDLSMEEFYAVAQDADYLIYNSSIDNPIESIEDLTAKDELFQEFKAVKEGNVWCTGKYLYQATDIVGNLIADIHLMLTDGDESQMTFLYQVD